VPNIGLPELVIVLVIALVVFGPKRLPEMGRQVGKAIREFRSATSDIRSQMGVDDLTDAVSGIKSDLSLTGDGQAASSGDGQAASSGGAQAAAPGEPGAAAGPADTDAAPLAAGAAGVAHYIAPGVTTADIGASSAVDAATVDESVAPAADFAGDAAADAASAAAATADETDVGVESFGSLTRRTARPSAG